MGENMIRVIRGNVFQSFLFAVCLVACAGAFGAKHSHPAPADKPSTNTEIRAVWASTLSPCMNTPEEIHRLVESTRKAHLNTIIAQVRHRGIVYYKSKAEPMAPAPAKIAGFDPLATLLKEAHETSGGQQRLDVYAWFNAFALEKIEQSSATEKLRPWLSLTTTGSVASFLDPAIPEVQNHLLSLVEDCLRDYDIDGINLDFIRYPENDAGYHPVAIKRFHEQYGSKAKASPDNPDWNTFRRDQVTAFVRRCHDAVLRLRPNAVISIDAIGFGGPPKKDFSDSRPYQQVHQDWAGWLRAGYIDAVTRMGYKRESVPQQAQDFRGWADFSRQLQDECPGRYVTLGIGGYLNTEEDTLTQYREAQKRNLGTSLFSYWRPTRASNQTNQYGPDSPFWEKLGTQIYPSIIGPVRPEARRIPKQESKRVPR
uniref:Glycosyl hydrolase-like 10 domain-containing protein n=1 Tax=uncultured bacterium AOCefta2 TaxID=654977 RepID=D6MLW5_9BACT|nr:hypothetical protein WISOIL_0016 [uncultured bacterium AOCefta2]